MSRGPWLVLTGLVAALAVVTTVRVSIDRRPPESDHANHLERALRCHRTLAEGGPGRWQAILEESSVYPPLVSCAAGLLYFVAPVAPLTAQAVMLGALALAAIFSLGRRLLGPEGGLLAAFFFAMAPFVVFSLNNFQLDLPLAAMVAVALYALARTEHFARPHGIPYARSVASPRLSPWLVASAGSAELGRIFARARSDPCATFADIAVDARGTRLS